MTDNSFIKWHIAGLHALRSASEQGVEGAQALGKKVDHPELQALLKEYGTLASQQQDAFVAFLGEFDTKPNGFKDRIMEGVSNGTREMVEAAPDQDTLNLSAIAGTQSGLDYYAGAFKGQGALAKQLGHTEQAQQLMTMSEACTKLNQQFVKAGDLIRAKAAPQAKAA